MKKKGLLLGLVAATAIIVGVRFARVPAIDEVFFQVESNAPASQIAPPRSEPHAISDTSASQPDQEQSKLATVAPSDPVLFSDIPEGAFKTGLMKLKTDVQVRVLDRLSRERQLLVDIDSIRVGSSGKIYYVCSFGSLSAEATSTAPDASVQEELLSNPMVSGSTVPISSPPALHSRPGAYNVLFLDFNGHVIEDTDWNTSYGVTSWNCLPYDKDGDTSTFSVSEMSAITQIWERVAEDFAPFDVDVTTEQPAVWHRRTSHALITPVLDANGVACPHFGYGGYAYIGVFGEPEYSYDYSGNSFSPAWCKDFDADMVAEVISHELGHNLGLHHDRTPSSAYYYGHSNGSISWAPIMGAGYGRDITQWSKGQYYQSINSEDDLLIIKSNLYYRADDHGDENGTATSMSTGSNGAVVQEGVIEVPGDVDVFSFVAGGEIVTMEVAPYQAASGSWGGNLDILLEIYNSSGTLVASVNPVAEAGVSITTNLTAGTYYLHIIPTALGDPFNSTPTGYTYYGVLGQYSIAGSLSSDIDGDGLPNDWEMMYFGGYTNAVAAWDEDSDGADNLTEYISGHNPKDAASVFKINSFYNPSPTSSRYVVTWSAVTGRVYGVNWSDQLNNTFTNISGDLPYPSGSYTDTVERIGPQHFYRIDVQLQP